MDILQKKLKSACKVFCRILYAGVISTYTINASQGSLLKYDKYRIMAGRPRFARTMSSLKYLGIGIGMNPYDSISDDARDKMLNLSNGHPNGISGQQLFEDNRTQANPDGNHTSMSHQPNLIGIPYIVFGFVPDTAPFIRNHFEFSFKVTSFDNSVSQQNLFHLPDNQKATYQELKMLDFSTRFLYEMYFQFGEPALKYSFFIGGGAGLVSNIILLQGTPEVKVQNNGTTTSNNSQNQSTFETISANYTLFSLGFSGTGGFTYDISPGIAIETKLRYIMMLTPFGSQIDIGQQTMEIVATILIRL
ncbi:hypothetical protein N9A04_00265 [Rickettsiales bacterium]|nr:hypothetical protein [Rickettsiales bacterium]